MGLCLHRIIKLSVTLECRGWVIDDLNDGHVTVHYWDLLAILKSVIQIPNCTKYYILLQPEDEPECESEVVFNAQELELEGEVIVTPQGPELEGDVFVNAQEPMEEEDASLLVNTVGIWNPDMSVFWIVNLCQVLEWSGFQMVDLA